MNEKCGSALHTRTFAFDPMLNAPMKVFLSWSGERSRLIAETLRNWLPDVIQNIEPWMSAADIDAGARWNRRVEDELAKSQVGILCLTRENQTAPWVLFEAGALAKTLAETLVCPYLIGFSATDLEPGPLTRFQAKEANAEGTWELVKTLNRALKENALAEERLRRVFDRFWPDLEKALSDLPPPRKRQARRSVEDMVDEILKVVRGLARRSPPPVADPLEYSWDDFFKKLDLESIFPAASPSQDPSESSEAVLGEALRHVARRRWGPILRRPESDDQKGNDSSDPPNTDSSG